MVRPGLEIWFRGRLCRLEVEFVGAEPSVGIMSDYPDVIIVTPIERGPRLVVGADDRYDSEEGWMRSFTLEESLSPSDWRELERIWRDAHPEYDPFMPVYQNADGDWEWRKMQEWWGDDPLGDWHGRNE